MKYFTKEELEDITGEILENPTRETLEKLNKKYNGHEETVEMITPVTPAVNEEPPVVVPMQGPVVNQIPNYNIPNNNIPNVEPNNAEMANFVLPVMEMPTVDQNNLMGTTNNFNNGPSIMPSTEVSVNPAPFFGPAVSEVGNPIPVSAPVQGPTMFGQLEQNYMQ